MQPQSSTTQVRRGELDDDLAEVDLSAELDVSPVSSLCLGNASLVKAVAGFSFFLCGTS